MPIKILMPALSPTMEEGNLAKWHKKEGDKVVPGDVIAEIETDKATMEVEAVDEGIIGKLIVPAGTENIPVNSLIAILLEEGENASTLENFKVETKDKNKQPDLKQNVKIESQISLPNELENIDNDESLKKRIFASPLARKIANLE